MAAIKVPKEFARQPRDLIQELERFKATEFRQLMLYTGPVILKNILPPDQYMHFLYLSIAMHILLDNDDTFRDSMIVFAQEMLMLFVKKAPRIYGDKFSTYNVHNLLHLVDDVRHFKCSLNKLAAFIYENHLGKLKNFVRNGNNPIVQITNRITVLENANKDGKPVKPELQIGGKQSDCYFLLEDFVAIVDMKLYDKKYQCKLYRIELLESFFVEPCDSKSLKIFFLSEEIPCTYRDLRESQLKQKMVGIKYSNRNTEGTVLIKFRHL